MTDTTTSADSLPFDRTPRSWALREPMVAAEVAQASHPDHEVRLLALHSIGHLVALSAADGTDDARTLRWARDLWRAHEASTAAELRARHPVYAPLAHLYGYTDAPTTREA